MFNKHLHFLKILLLSGYFFIYVPVPAQISPGVSDSLYKIAGTTTVSKHFAVLYYKATLEAEKYAAAQSPAADRFLTAFENSFAQYFFDAAKNNGRAAAQTFSWQRYYNNAGLNDFQYYFLGMNAHINGDMWRALVQTHPYDSIKKYRQVLHNFQCPLAALFDSTYNACRKYKKLNRFHRLTLGLGKWYGKNSILHWRSNQMQLALLYYKNTVRFNRRLQKTQRKMKRLDAFVIKRFS